MKTSLPLFARLLLWFFINLLVLIAGLALMIRLQFGSLNNWLLPSATQDEIQSMCIDLIGNLAHSDRNDWGGELAQLSLAYKMDFALFDSRGQWLAGAVLRPPKEIERELVFGPSSHPTPGWDRPPPEHDRPPPGGPREDNSIFGDLPPPPEDRPPPPPGAPIPEFPKNILKSDSPEAYWLLVRLPQRALHTDGPITLLGMAPALGASPLLQNPKPWIMVPLSILMLSILFWLPMARNLTNPIIEMTRATESIAAGHFDIKLADSRSDELGRLSHAINRMAGRLKDFVTGQKRFLGDAAHELCSPLARMEIALGILEERSDASSRPLLNDVREEVTHMQKLANELLSFSKASLGEKHLKLEPVNVAEMVEAAMRQEKCDARQFEVHISDELFALGHFELLLRSVANLVRNAQRYAGEAGPVTVVGALEGEKIVLTVSDHGPGVATSELDKLFDPFYRVDPSRTSETGGVGLGLAIVKSCVEACGGSVAAANREPHGLEVRIRLQRA